MVDLLRHGRGLSAALFAALSASVGEAAPRVSPLAAPVGDGKPGFTRLAAAQTGLSFTNRVPADRHLTNQIYLNGSGVTAGDMDGDGRPDVFFAGMGGGSALFRNLGGWQFTNVTATSFPAGAWGPLDATGCVFADLDGDGDLDLVVNTVGQGTRLWFNDGAGHFTEAAPVNPGRGGMSLAVADVDGDGDLDLYVANYRTTTLRDDPVPNFRARNEGGRTRILSYNGRSTSEPDLVGRFSHTPGGVQENGEPDALFLNDGKGRFTPVGWTDGTFLGEDGQPLPAAPRDWGLGCLLRDFTGDGKPDLYVCDDFQSPDRIWINETAPGGPLRFRAASPLAVRATSAFSMGVDVADVDRDGHDDLFTLDMLSRDHGRRNVQVAGLPPNVSEPGRFADRLQSSRNMLLLGRGDGTFAEVGRLAGLAASEWSWTPAFLDVDLDGWEDLLITNGHELEMMDADIVDRAEAEKSRRKLSARELLAQRQMFPRHNVPNAAFRNNRDLTFTDVSHAWGFDLPEVSHGMALADLDGDGDLDVLINDLNGPAAVLRNNAGAHRLAVRLRGAGANTRGLGAKLRVLGGPVAQSQEMVAGGRYLSSDDAMRTFAAGAARALTVEVTWRSGLRTIANDVKPNQLIELSEADPASSPSPIPHPPSPGFTDVSAVLGHTHHEEPFDDFARQPLLPRNLSQAGPGATWADLDGDGREDLLLGTGANGMLAAFHNDGGGRFSPLTNAVLAKPATRDLTSLLAIGPVVFAGSSNYEDGSTNGGVLRLWDLARGATGDSVLGQGFSAGPLAMADVDGDGSLEFFVGGRAIAGRWPEPATSLLLKSVNGRFTVMQRFEALGLVNGACFTDFDGDGDADLVLATEWGPIRLFRNDGGKFSEVTKELGLAEFTGWWNSVATADLDEDGRPDLIAGNWGWNLFPGVTPENPAVPMSPRSPLRRCRYGDLNGDGVLDIIESYFDAAGRELPVRKADAAFAALPFLRDKFPTRAAYGAATLGELHGDALAKLPVLEARWSATTVFLNRGDRFEAHALPLEAQFSPAFGLAVADFDGDGHDDVFLAQNFFPVHRDDARQDAGRGLLLRGDGHGKLTPVPGETSGLVVHGEGRAAAVADFDGDGRSDLVVTQNGAATKLFRNATARQGLRVRLAGTGQNEHGFGATLRLFAGERGGAARELHAGAGYWSGDAPTVVMTHTDKPTRLRVRWPGGAEKTYPLPEGARSVEAAPDGSLRMLP